MATTTRGTQFWIGWGLSGLMIAFLLLDATMKLLALPEVLEASAPLGFPGVGMAHTLGVTLIISTVLYLAPRTAVLGAILLTGYLGGAVATHVRVGAGLFPILFPVIIGLLVWGGIYLRDERLRALLPLRS